MTRSKKRALLWMFLIAVLVAGGALAAFLRVGDAVRANPVVLRNVPAGPGNPSSFVLTSPQGVRVFLDMVALPDDLAPALDDPRSLFVVTHKHPDHFAAGMAERFKGGKLVAQPGMLASGDVRVELLRSSHIDDNVDGTDHIAVVDVGNLRVVHFGDCGQSRLSPEQLARIGRVDVMIGEFVVSSYLDEGQPSPALTVVGQVAPTLIVPTHLVELGVLSPLLADYRTELAQRPELTLTPKILAMGKRIVLMGDHLGLARRGRG